MPIPGTPPSLINRPSGCHFHPRCPYAQPDHARIDPALEPVPDAPDHFVACLLEADVRRRLWAQLERRARRRREALAAVGSAGATRAEQPRATPLVRVRDLVKHFPITRGIIFQRKIGAVQAVDGVSFEVGAARRSGSSARPAAARARPRG